MKSASFRDTYIGFKLRQFKHRLTFSRKHPRTKNSIKRYKDCNDKKPMRQIRAEIAICKNFWGCYPLHYFRYDLYRKDKKLTKEQLINYIPEFFFYNLFLPHYDGNKYSILLVDKNLTEQLFRSVSIHQPYTICKLINGKTYAGDLKEKNFNEISLDLKQNKFEKIFIKPVDGEGGYGIKIFHLSENNKYINNNNEEFNETYLSDIGMDNDYIIQSGVIQSESFSKIYPSSVNTFRITTENIEDKVKIICAVLRMGKEGVEVDNGSQSGIAVGIDCNTGKCNDYGTTEDGEVFYENPDTNFIFKNYKIDDWDSIVSFTLESAARLPQFTYLGWDIAFTDKGPIAIETNLEFGLDIYQIALGGLKEAFKISDPNKYWKSRG